MKYVLFNPLANNKKGRENAESVKKLLPEDEKTEFIDVTEIKDMSEYLTALPDDGDVILCGGDGTLNVFINLLGGKVPERKIFYCPCGSGNDFMNDLKTTGEDGLVEVNKYLYDLPVVTVNGKDYFFLNNVGYGIDGYCCEEGDKVQKKNPGKPVNYTAIAIKGMLYKFSPRKAKITVDGVSSEHKNVWLCPTMNGMFYGGGMMIAPDQDRLNAERTVSAFVMVGRPRLRVLIAFPDIFKGELEKKHPKLVKGFHGHEVTVEFNKPTALQIDGETILGVTTYTVRAGKAKENAFKAEETATV